MKTLKTIILMAGILLFSTEGFAQNGLINESNCGEILDEDQVGASISLVSTLPNKTLTHFSFERMRLGRKTLKNLLMKW